MLGFRKENQVRICLNPEIPSIMARVSTGHMLSLASLSEISLGNGNTVSTDYLGFCCLCWRFLFSHCEVQTASQGQGASFPSKIPFSSVFLLPCLSICFPERKANNRWNNLGESFASNVPASSAMVGLPSALSCLCPLKLFS